MIDLLTNFYAIPLQQVVVLMILVIAIWIFLGGFCDWHGKKARKSWRCVNLCLCVLSVIVIIKMTLIGRTVGVRQLELRPFYTFTTVSYNNEAFRTLLMNIFLFFPLGLTLPWTLDESESAKYRIVKCVLIGLGLSIGIESIQFAFGLGRAETDDVICNTLGCMTGVLAFATLRINQIVRRK